MNLCTEVRRGRLIAGAIGLLLGVAFPAAAQGPGGPPAGVEDLFGWRRPQESAQSTSLGALRIDLSGGYDSNLDPQNTGGDQVADLAGTLALSGRFWSGRTNQYFNLTGNAWTNYQRVAADPLRGTDVTVDAVKELGPRAGLLVSGAAAYRPSYLFGGLGALTPPADLDLGSVAVPHPQGVVEERWLVFDASIGVFRQLTTRQRLEFSVVGNRQDPLHDSGFDSRSATVAVSHTWAFRQRASLLTSYRVSENTQAADAIASRPLRLQQPMLGMRVERRTSPTRTVALSFAAGPSLVSLRETETSPAYDAVVASGWGMLQWAVTRDWSLTAEASRSVTALDGISPEPFITDSGTVSFGGIISRRYSLSLIGAASRGSALASTVGAFDTLSGTVQAQYALARKWVVFGSYSYYEHELNDLSLIPSGFPPTYERHTVRVGLSIGVPLYSNSQP